MNGDRLRQIVDEYKNAERPIYQTGSFHLEQGFTIFPKKNEDVEIDRPEKGQIYRPLSFQEAEELSQNPYCTNRESIKMFLDSVQLANT